VVQADNQWSNENLELALLEIQEILLSELESLTDLSLQNFTHIDVQRWRYAKVSSAAGRDFFIDKDAKIAACGDWCRGDRIEDAFLSGRGLAMELIKGQIL
jgi:predicted NAD/FAD-dependent oxidoreductase